MTRAGDWVQTATGAAFWPLDPRPEEVRIEDIAHALSLKCRFGGHCRDFYSVAQHSVLVSENVPKQHALWGLLHDAAEAYLPDVVRPIKPYLEGFEEIEAGVMAAVCEKFGLPKEMPDNVKRVDTAILADEAAQLMLPPPFQWALPEAPLGLDIVPWPPSVAKRIFTFRLEEYLGCQ